MHYVMTWANRYITVAWSKCSSNRRGRWSSFKICERWSRDALFCFFLLAQPRCYLLFYYVTMLLCTTLYYLLHTTYAFRLLLRLKIPRTKDTDGVQRCWDENHLVYNLLGFQTLFSIRLRRFLLCLLCRSLFLWQKPFPSPRNEFRPNFSKSP